MNAHPQTCDDEVRAAILTTLATMADGVILALKAAEFEEERGRPEWAAGDREWCANEAAKAEHWARTYWAVYAPSPR